MLRQNYANKICKVEKREEKKKLTMQSYNFFIAIIILNPKGIISIRLQHKQKDKMSF